MHMKPKQPLVISLSLTAVALAAVLAWSLEPAATSLSLGVIESLIELPPGLPRSSLILLAFIGGIALTITLIVRPMRNAYQEREQQLKNKQKQLEALNDKLHRQATSDGLLGIANRREFERVLKLEWRRAARERQPLSLLLIDVDNFKVFNDTYGHLEGDECLRHIASTLKEAAARPGDLVARYGGEEMAILLPRTELEGATHMAQRIHDLLAERACAFPASPVANHVTVSIGVTSMLPVRHANAHTLIKQADEGLYAAKANGRNRTEVVSRIRLIASMDDAHRKLSHRA
ncbi:MULTISPECIES: diguanylate cyclase [Halomonadaceae]|uniref:diguanylate cyclase n=1 Tax=Halomonadaceae TaxID=28256 RepID=UPI0015991801|nr:MULTISPECIES: diguanylate cyclase [Halomonas]QJQ95127.1 diguanylate cyclase [Halomonas sp. PA5]